MFKEIQTQHREWLASMFPGQEPFIPAAGVFEEVGEIVQCIVKIEQTKRWGREPRHVGVDWQAKLTDAIADCAIYLGSYCAAKKFDWAARIEDAKAVQYGPRASMLDLASLCTAAAAFFDDAIKSGGSSTQVCNVLAQLMRLSLSVGVDFDDAVRATWETVKLRKRKS